MYFILSKLLSFLINPMFWILICIIFAWRSKNFQKTKKWLYYSLLIIFLLGNTFVFNLFAKWWEKGCSSSYNEINQYATIIVLGGYNSWNSMTQFQDLNEAADRLVTVLPMIEDSMKSIIFSGGSGIINHQGITESQITQNYLTHFHHIAAKLYYENESKNTKENISFSNKLVNQYKLKNIVVVSSSYHIPRIRKIIASQGLHWHTAGVESLVDHELTPSDYWLPKAENLQKWNILLHEWIGYIVN